MDIVELLCDIFKFNGKKCYASAGNALDILAQPI